MTYSKEQPSFKHLGTLKMGSTGHFHIIYYPVMSTPPHQIATQGTSDGSCFAFNGKTGGRWLCVVTGRPTLCGLNTRCCRSLVHRGQGNRALHRNCQATQRTAGPHRTHVNAHGGAAGLLRAGVSRPGACGAALKQLCCELHRAMACRDCRASARVRHRCSCHY